MEKTTLLNLLESYQTPFDEERFFRQLTLDFIRENDHFWQRSNLVGHLTGSAWVLNPARDAALLIHHRALDKWFQPGGHADAEDDTLEETARREAREECGLGDLHRWSDGIFDLDIHIIPAKKDIPQHLHYDIRFAFVVETDTLHADFSEVHGAQWVPLAELTHQPNIQQAIRRMALKSC